MLCTFEEKALSDEGWLDQVSDLLASQEVQKMKTFKHHRNTTCFTHCVHVSYSCYLWFEKHNWNSYLVVRCALLHDLFLYQREDLRIWWKKYTHVFTHGHTAMLRAKDITELSKKGERAIARHMFPLTLLPPTSREALAICIWDKVWCIKEVKGIC